MNKTAVATVGFALGAVAGAIGAWYVLKTKYERIAQEEIDSVKETFKRMKADNEKADRLSLEEAGSTDVENDDWKVVKEMNTHLIEYCGYSGEDKPKKSIDEPRPYLIPPEELGTYDDYHVEELIFFSDNVLCDEEYEPIENVEDVVGFESLNHFGEYDDDTVYVRNDKRKCDYEITLDERTYLEAKKMKPDRKGVL